MATNTKQLGKEPEPTQAHGGNSVIPVSKKPDGSRVSRYRKITPYEWAYLAATPGFPPFVIQLRIDIAPLPTPESLEQALAAAAAVNPGARLVARGHWWWDSGEPPRLRQIASTESFSLQHPRLQTQLPSHVAPPIEVLYWHGRSLIFRCAHALMDAGGLLFFAKETFRALRGDSLLGTPNPVSDHAYLSRLRHPRPRPLFKPDKPSPLGAASSTSSDFAWASRFVSGQVTSPGARIAAALNHLSQEAGLPGDIRIMMPVDLRQPDPSLRSTANLTNALFLEIPSGASWRQCYRDILLALGRNDERAIARTDTLLPWLPQTVLRSILTLQQKRQLRSNRYFFSALSSNVGPVALTDFHHQGSTPSALAFLPFNVPVSALSLLTLQHDHGLEIAASCPAACADNGRLDALLDRVCAELTEGVRPAQLRFAAQPPQEKLQANISLMIIASFVAEPLTQPLTFWLEQFDLPACIQFAPYNQLFQTLMDPAGELLTDATGINIVLLRLEDWLRDIVTNDNPQKNLDAIQKNAEDLVTAIKAACARTSATLIVWLAPLSGSKNANDLARTHQYLLTQLQSIIGVVCIPPADLARLYPVDDMEDEFANILGHVPYTEAMYTALATLIVRKIVALKAPPYKVIVLDCDNTLWQGVCAELGPKAVAITPRFQTLQTFMLDQFQAGVLLCLCSKNIVADVDNVLNHNPDMLLRREHFVASRINWRPKSENIRSLAQELDLALDSFIFIDDNPIECAEVQAHCEGVLVLHFPPATTSVQEFLDHVWPFDRPVLTEDGQQRSLRYQHQLQRQALRNQMSHFDDFLASLALQVHIAPLEPQHLERVAELSRRTNQFNLRPQPRHASEIRTLTDTYSCLTVNVEDRFGHYGLTGLIVYKPQGQVLHVDTFLLSCRVLGRGVEHRVLAELGHIAEGIGCNSLELHFQPTAKNQPALDFLATVAATTPALLSPPSIVVPLERALHLPPTQVVFPTLDRTNESTPEANLNHIKIPLTSQPTLFSRIVKELHCIEQIMSVIQAAKVPPTLVATAAPANAMANGLQEILTDVTKGQCQTLALDTSLLDLGLSSLQTVQLLARSARRFAPSITPEQLFLGLEAFLSKPTLQQLQWYLEKQVQQADKRQDGPDKK